MADTTAFVLVHSPLVGPLTWIPVANELRSRGVEAVVPVLPRGDDAPVSFWKRDSEAVADVVRGLPTDRDVVLVGHSGAGPLLPAIRESSLRAVAAYVFVDAGLPEPGQPRIGAGPFAEYLTAAYARGESFPNWTDEDLREILPDPQMRRRLISDLRPQPWAFWTEAIPVFAGWPDAPCFYLRFTPNPAYDSAAAAAEARGWPCREIHGGHFHMLVDPPAVADVLLDLSGHRAM